MCSRTLAPLGSLSEADVDQLLNIIIKGVIWTSFDDVYEPSRGWTDNRPIVGRRFAIVLKRTITEMWEP